MVCDLVREMTGLRRPSIAQPGDSVGFGISRAWNGQNLELSVLVNGTVASRFLYAPACPEREGSASCRKLRDRYAPELPSSPAPETLTPQPKKEGAPEEGDPEDVRETKKRKPGDAAGSARQRERELARESCDALSPVRTCAQGASAGSGEMEPALEHPDASTSAVVAANPCKQGTVMLGFIRVFSCTVFAPGPRCSRRSFRVSLSAGFASSCFVCKHPARRCSAGTLRF